LNFIFNVLDLSRITISSIVGDQGIARSTPGGSTLNLIGKGFFPSSVIKIKYSSGFLTFENNCQFISSTNITCGTNNIYSTGIALPRNFDIEFSMNGFDFSKVGIPLTFLESDVPTIVQAVPIKGPLYPDTPYNIFVKGITKSIDECVWTSKTKQTIYITIRPVASDTEINCPVPAYADIVAKGDQNDFGVWRLRLRNSKTLQASESTPITFYPNPTINSINPTEGRAFGGTVIEIFGSGFTLPGSGLDPKGGYKMTFKLTDIRSSIDCNIFNDTYSTCTAPSHPEDSTVGARISLSFNENDFYKWKNGTYKVHSCGKGLAGKDFEAPCTPCLPGTFKPQPGFFDCILCTANTYEYRSYSEDCPTCPPRTISKPGSKNITDCDCEPGTWRKNSTTSGIECDVCVTGGRCNGGGEHPYPKVGYYWDKSDNEAPFKFVPCRVEEYCTGNTTNGAEGCIEGRTGLLCEDCSPNYFKSSGKCEKCNTDVQWRMILVVIGLVILILIFFKFAQLKVSHLSSFSIASEYYQIIAVFSAYNFKWPSGLKTALGYLKFLNLDLDIFVPECISVITYAMKWAATLCIPIIFAGLLFLGFLLEVIRSLAARIWGPLVRKLFAKLYHVNRQNWLTKQASLFVISSLEFFAAPKSFKEISEFGDKCIHTFVIIISFSYVFVVTKASQIFNCVSIQGVLKMDSERTVTCFQNDWWWYFPFSIITLLTFGLGVVVLFAYVLLFKKRILADKKFNARFRFLFVRFRDERLFWQMVIIIRKLLISTAVIFFSGFPMLVILFSMFIMFSAFILQSHHIPYRRKFHNLMEYVVLLSTEILLFCALLFYVDDFPDEWNKELLGVLCITLIVVTTILIVGIVVFDFILQWTEDRAEARKQKQMRDLDAGTANNMSILMDDQDIALAKYGLKKRTNQSTVVVDENGTELVKAKIPTTQQAGQQIEVENKDDAVVELSGESSNDVTNAESKKDKLIMLKKGNDKVSEVDDIELKDIDVESRPEINDSQQDLVVSSETGIAEIPDDEERL
jgi:hypothetical protein